MFRAHFRIVNSFVIGLMQQMKVNVSVLFVFGVHGLHFKGHEAKSQLTPPTRPKL
jgi:hypothetical protein